MDDDKSEVLYRKMYFGLFRAATEALEAMAQQNFGAAADRLRREPKLPWKPSCQSPKASLSGENRLSFHKLPPLVISCQIQHPEATHFSQLVISSLMSCSV